MPYAHSVRVLAAAVLVLAAAVPSAHAQRLPRVALATAEEAEIVEELSLTGTLTSPQSARLAPQVEGRLAAIPVDAGDRVEAGERLATLDSELARLELESAAAAVEEAEAELDDARRRLDEARNLAERQSVAESEVRAREAEVRRDRAVLARRRAEHALQAALVERHTLAAPFAGVIGRRMGELGEWLQPDTPVLELVRVDHLRLDLRVPQGYFGRIGRDTGVRVRLDAMPERHIDARIATIVPVTDPEARTFLARVDIANPGDRMTPGMSARATLRIDTGRTGVVVPRDALIRYPDGRVVVWVAEGNGATRTVSERRVETGLAFGDRIAIRDGLEAGTPVVVRGNEALQDDQEVRVEDDG